MLTILISTLTILALTICFLGYLVMRLISMLTRIHEEGRAENRALLGLSPVQMSSPPRMRETLPEPEPDPLSELENLPPEIQDTLMREYQEAMAQNPRNRTVHPEVEQIVPGQPMSLSG
jgi:hypothetical protein